MNFNEARPRSPEELAAAIDEYFSALDLSQGLSSEHVRGFLVHLAEEGATAQGLEMAWTDVELFCAFLENSPAIGSLETMDSWQFSRFIFDFLEKEVYDPRARRSERKRQLLATIVGLFGHLFSKGVISSAQSAEDALGKIFAGPKPRRLSRPVLRPEDRLGWVTGPTTGVAHPIRALDLWLTVVRDADFEGEWKALIQHLDQIALPDADVKKEAAMRLESISSQDEVDPLHVLGDRQPSRAQIERARKYFYREENVRRSRSGRVS